jgi:hypothetical protein
VRPIAWPPRCTLRPIEYSAQAVQAIATSPAIRIASIDLPNSSIALARIAKKSGGFVSHTVV